jgi:outer membrane protein TolC
VAQRGDDSAAQVGILAGADVSPILRYRAPIDLGRTLELSGETPNIVRFAKARAAQAEAEFHEKQATVILPTLHILNELEIHEGAIQLQQTSDFARTGRRDFLGLRVIKDWNLLTNYEDLAAKALERDAQRHDLASVQISSFADGAEAYFSLQQAQADVGIARDALARAKEFLGIASALEREKLGLTVDRLQADAEVARRSEREVAAEESFRDASAALATFLRLDPTVLFYSEDATVTPVTFIPPETSVDQLIASAYETRPDVRAEDERVRARQHETSAAEVGPFVPHLVLGLIGHEGGLGFEMPGADFSSPKARADYYVGIQWELTGAGLGDYYHAEVEDSLRTAARVHLDDKREHVANEIIQAHQAIRSRFLAIESAKREVAATEEAWTIAKKRLEQGIGLAVDVLAAIEAHTVASTHLVDAITQYNKNQFRLLARLGEKPSLAK